MPLPLIQELLKQPVRHEKSGGQTLKYLQRDEVMYTVIEERNRLLDLFARLQADPAYMQLAEGLADEIADYRDGLDQPYFPEPYAPNEQPDLALEERYIVIKRKDIPNDGEELLRVFLKQWDIPTRAGVLVEASNPLYPSVTQAIIHGGHFDPRVNKVLDAIAEVFVEGVVRQVKAIMENGDGQGSLDIGQAAPAAVPGRLNPPL